MSRYKTDFEEVEFLVCGPYYMRVAIKLMACYRARVVSEKLSRPRTSLTADSTLSVSAPDLYAQKADTFCRESEAAARGQRAESVP
jgi:hypothetical protein